METRCRRVLQAIARVASLDQFRGERHLDIGCDTGVFARGMARLVGTIPVGIDVSHRAIAAAQREGIEAYQTTIEDAPASLNDFALVTAIDLIEHVADPKRFVDSVAARLRRGGVLYIETPNLGSIVYKIGALMARVTHGRPAWICERLFPAEHAQYFSPAGIKALSEEAGLVVTHLEFRRLGRHAIAASAAVRLAMEAMQSVDLVTGKCILLCAVLRKS